MGTREEEDRGQNSVNDKVHMDNTQYDKTHYIVHLFKTSYLKACLLMLTKIELKRMNQEDYYAFDIVLSYMVIHAEMTQ